MKFENQTEISIVIPVYKGAEFLVDLVREIDLTRKKLASQIETISISEAIFVSDDCKDDSDKILYELAETHPWIKVIELSKNFGQHPATMAGILYSSGDWIITMDEDLQHHPKNIIPMLAHTLSNSSDICYASPKDKVHNSIIRDQLALLYKLFISNISQNKHVLKFNSFRLIRGTIARASASTAANESYLDMVLCWFTDRIVTHQVEMLDTRNQELKGKSSGYSVWSLVKHGKRMLMTTKVKFLRIGFVLGVFSFALSVVFLIYAVARRVLDPETQLVTEWSSLMLAILFFGGFLSLLMTLLIENSSDVMIHLKGKPNYFVIDRSKDKKLLEKILKHQDS